jgi:pyridoxal phosphate enzyme (YggS family)
MTERIRENFERIRERLTAASMGREVKILAASKTMPPEILEEAFRVGVRVFGENRIQEAIPKIQALSALEIEWHFIGHLQTNKAREAVRYFSCIQSVDSVRLMRMIEKEAEKLGKSMDLFFEIDLAGEETKHGMPPDQLSEALAASSDLKWSKVGGLMIIPPFFENPEQTRPFFRKLRDLRNQHAERFPDLKELSMGMSHDYVVAVEEGATVIRVGTSLFGPRTK